VASDHRNRSPACVVFGYVLRDVCCTHQLSTIENIYIYIYIYFPVAILKEELGRVEEERKGEDLQKIEALRKDEELRKAVATCKSVEAIAETE
jgi:hypothetical protein